MVAVGQDTGTLGRLPAVGVGPQREKAGARPESPVPPTVVVTDLFSRTERCRRGGRVRRRRLVTTRDPISTGPLDDVTLWASDGGRNRRSVNPPRAQRSAREAGELQKGPLKGVLTEGGLLLGIRSLNEDYWLD